MKSRLPALILPALLLSACGDDTSTPAAKGDERTASGEVLEGTISDAMLPLDTVTSQPPLLKLEPKPEETADDTDAQRKKPPLLQRVTRPL